MTRKTLVESLISVTLLCFLGVIGYKLIAGMSPAVPAPLVGRMAPNFKLTSWDGGQVSLAQYRGRPVIINLWASWCGPCRDESGVLEQGWQTYKSEGVVFIGIDVQDTDKDARAFLKEYNPTYPGGRDPDGAVSIDYGITGVPETFFINPSGRIIHKFNGPLTSLQLSEFIQEIQH